MLAAFGVSRNKKQKVAESKAKVETDFCFQILEIFVTAFPALPLLTSHILLLTSHELLQRPSGRMGLSSIV